MSIGTAIMLSILAGFAYWTRRFLGDWFLDRPIVVAPITGLIMGDFHLGLIVGGTLELIFMGATDIGGSVPPNYNIGSILGAAFAISSGQGISTAVLIAVPAALLGSFAELLAKTVSVFFIHAADRMADDGNYKGIARMLHLGNLVHFLADAIPTFIALTLGANAVKAIMNDIPHWLQNGITATGDLLPALGFALLLSTLASPAMFPFYFIGFLLAAYTKMGVLGVAVMALLVAIVLQSRKPDDDHFDAETEIAATTTTGHGGVLDKKDLRLLWLRSFGLQSAFSFDRMQAIGFAWAMTPLLRKIYRNQPQEFSLALKRHLMFINTNPWVSGPIFAMTADLEIRKALGEQDIEEQAIQGLKSGLMGPLAGVGDSMFQGTLRPVVAGVMAGLALQGNPLAPFLFIAIVNAVHIFVSWYTFKKGFDMGDQFLGVLASGRIRKVMEGATMTGLMAVGALTATWLTVSTPLTYHVQKATVSLQTMLDGIMPDILPLAATMLVFWLVRRRFNTTRIMLGMIVVGLVLGSFNIIK